MAAKVPMDKVMEVLSAGRDADRDAAEVVRIRVFVDPTASRDLVLAVRGALRAEGKGGVVDVDSLEGGFYDDGTFADVVVVIPGEAESAAASAVSSYARRGVPVAVVVESAVDVPRSNLGDSERTLVTAISASEPAVAPAKLAEWLVAATPKHLAFSANFPFCREAEVSQLVKRCALENAAVGAVTLIPGSDMPVMTANQAKLALDIAAAHGKGLEPARAAELVGVLGAAFAYRAVARQVVGLVPGIGWALKAGIGYLGTLATGSAVQARFGLASSGARKDGGNVATEDPASVQDPVRSLPGATDSHKVSRRR